jgi:hypothetical protein
MQVYVTTLSMFLLNVEELIIPYHSKYNVFVEYGVCVVDKSKRDGDQEIQ